jgi:curved DNA-binding protein CbpA
MADPYHILGVPMDVVDADLRRRYLKLVRQYPPEKSPRRFAEIRAAYELLRDPVQRLERQLFQVCGDETLADILADLRSRVQAVRIPTETLLSLSEG